MPKKKISDQTSSQFLNRPSSAFDLVLKLLIKITKKYLFIDALSRAKFYICFVILLSLIGEFVSLPNHYYFVQV